MDAVELPSPDTVFAPVRSPTAFEETLERLGTAIKLGLLTPGARLPPERELCTRLEISRSTLRQALTALAQSGHLRARRGHGGGTFVAERPPPADPPTEDVLASWREACDLRLAVELGAAALAAQRATPAALAALDELVGAMDAQAGDFPAYRQADVRFHIGLAELSGSGRLIATMTEAQSAMTDLLSHIPHPLEVLEHANAQHRRLLTCVRDRQPDRAMQVMAEHLEGTEHVFAALLPGED